MASYATCPDCDWRVEADDHRDADRAAMFHWDAAHAPVWCYYCEPLGPETKRLDHDECAAVAELDYLEDLRAEGWLR